MVCALSSCREMGMKEREGSGQGRQATKKASPPPDARAPTMPQCRPGKPPAATRFPQANPVPHPPQPRGCKGRSPLHKKTKNLPLPRRGRGSGGMGAESKAKGRVGRRQRKQAPAGRMSAHHAPVPPGQAPPPQPAFHKQTQCRIPPSPGDARGEAPCIRKLKSPPSPEGKSALRARVGGISFPFGEGGQQSKLKAGAAGNQEGKPPATTRFPQATPVPHPTQPRGCKGRSPLHKKTKNLPLPRRGRGSGGWGQQSKLKAGSAGNQEGKPPLSTCKAESAGNQKSKPP